MKRKLISFLGTGLYDSANYYYGAENTFLAYETPFVQLALTHIFKPDEVVIFLTPQAEGMNWLGTEQKTSSQGEIYPKVGLKELASKNFPAIPFEPISIPGGQGEKEIWEIFEKFHAQLTPGDAIIFDITHSFRSIPVIGLACLQYTRSIKDIKVEGIYYGNWEARTKSHDEQTSSAPVENVTSFFELMDWSYAVQDFQRHGQVGALVDLLKAKILPKKKKYQGKDEESRLLDRLGGLLKKTQSNIATCRGLEIYAKKPWETANELIKELQDTPNTISAFYPLLDMLQAKLGQLHGPEINASEEVRKGFGAIGWCLEHGLTQQAYTLFQENLITWICQQCGYDYKSRPERELVAHALSLSLREIPQSQWYGEAGENPEKIKHIQQRIDKDFLKLYDELNQKRNDINHAGTVDCFEPEKLNSKIQQIYNQLMEKI